MKRRELRRPPMSRPVFRTSRLDVHCVRMQPAGRGGVIYRQYFAMTRYEEGDDLAGEAQMGDCVPVASAQVWRPNCYGRWYLAMIYVRCDMRRLGIATELIVGLQRRLGPLEMVAAGKAGEALVASLTPRRRRRSA